MRGLRSRKPIGFRKWVVHDWEFISFTDPKNEVCIGLLIKLGYKDLGYVR